MSRIKPLYDNVKLNMVIVSDTHIDIKHPCPMIPKKLLMQTLSQSQHSQKRADAYITVGDTTSRGSEINWKLTKECFKKYDPADNVILTVGNHDCWDDEGYKKALERYIDNFNTICSFKIDRTYFSKVIKGYHLIFLGNEGDSGCESYISDEQVEWFENEMKLAGESGKPIFVFCHQSLNGKHGLPRTFDREEKPDAAPDEGGIGDRSDDIERIMKQYKNVFYFSGHSHMGIAGTDKAESESYSSIEQEDSLILINLPSLACGNHHGDNNGLGIGMLLEAYDDKVLLRFRSFMKHCNIKDIAIQGDKPIYEVKI